MSSDISRHLTLQVAEDSKGFKDLAETIVEEEVLSSFPQDWLVQLVQADSE